MAPDVPRGHEVRARILAAAATLFAENGFAGASVDEIARRAEVNKAMLYYYIGDKAELFATVLEEYLEDVRAELEKVIAKELDPEARLRGMGVAIQAMFRTRPSLPEIVAREVATAGATLPDRVLKKIGQIINVTYKVVEEAKAQGKFRDVHPLVVHVMLIGMSALFLNVTRLRSRIEKVHPLPGISDPTPEQLAQQMSDIILHGISIPMTFGGNK